MRSKNLQVLAMAFMLSATSAIASRPVRADDASLSGNWKVVVLPYGEDEFAIVKVTEKDGKTTAAVVDAQPMLTQNKVKTIERKDGTLSIALSGPNGDTTFKGTLATNGPQTGKFLGAINFRGSSYPARLEKTEGSKVAPLKQSAIISKLNDAQKAKDPKAKIKQLEDAIQSNHGSPINALFYTEMLNSAAAAGLETAKVGDVIKKWMDETKPYGDAWTNEVRLQALKAVGSSEKFAKMAVELAQDAEKVVSEEALESKATVIGLLAAAARSAGMTELANESDARHAKLSQRLDEEYHQKVPPFKTATYAGRMNKMADQVVLMELFTGAQCPPCVAADVAFDSLLKTYKPTDFIGLQYHLHIPGPDPLTNRDSIARQKYYGSEVHGTPSTFFNGRSEAAGGGPMGNSNRKYDEYRNIIDKSLEGTKGATIYVSAVRAGDQIKIVASATMVDSGADRKLDNAKAAANGKDGDKSKAENNEPKRVLRLALTEESVRYAGGNKLRFHEHVVRALPGGADGKALKDGAGKIDVVLDLADVKRGLQEYLSEFAKTRKFPASPPEIKLDHLAVVAFVQDDDDKRVLHAVSVPVENARP